MRELRFGLIAALAALALAVPNGSPPQAHNALPSSSTPSADAPPAPLVADWGDTPVSDQVRKIAQWSAATQDHAGMPFVVIDKQRAHLYLFDASARLQADTPVLLGLAMGDHTVPGIGEKPIADVLPEERTTPAGRFHGLMGENLTGEDVVWVDYDAAVSMHRVRPTKASERRLERLATQTVDDNRISYGCINVPVAFFETHILPVFTTQAAPIYVLPDHKTLDQVFALPPPALNAAALP